MPPKNVMIEGVIIEISNSKFALEIERGTLSYRASEEIWPFSSQP